MKKNVTLFLILFVLLIGMSVFGYKKYNFVSETVDGMAINAASVFFSDSKSALELQSKYTNSQKTGQKLNLLIVPGHEPGEGGAEYRNLKERDMTVELAADLADLLKNNPHYNFTTTRTSTAWNPVLSDYFSKNWDSIKQFTATQGQEMNRLVADGKIEKVDNGANHVDAPTDVALRLYGINKWSNENGIDLAIHIHFNDYPRKKQSEPGNYTGFTIYVPEKQYSNSEATKPIADAVFKRLSSVFPVSDYPAESGGVVEEQELIAIGSRNTADAASMLIEYGYLYEPQFQNDAVRHAVLKEMALQTYLGLEDFFTGKKDTHIPYSTSLISSKFRSEITKNSDPLSVLSLQAALMLSGFYPAGGDSKNDCPLSGNIGPCTLAALKTFQNTYGITGEKGKAGKKTINKLNATFGLLP